ncbi:MAG: hypothetical protein ACI4I5_02480 [Acutalibacteraceae bacterium]
MFTVLQVTQEKPRGFARILWKLHPPEPEFVKVAVKSGAPFFILRVRTAEKAPPWEDILYTVGRCASRILTDTDISLPENRNVRLFAPKHLPLIAAMRTMTEVLSLSDIPPHKCVIGVYDPFGSLCGRAEQLLQCASDVRVCTQRTAEYDEESRRLFRLCGAGLTVGETTDLFRRCNILLCADADIFPAQCVTFACRGTARENLFLCKALDIPEPYRSQTPENIDPGLFASALYELCGVRSLEQCRYSCILHEQDTWTLPEAAARFHARSNT